MSISQLGGIEKLIMHEMKPPTIEDARRFGGCLNLCHNVKKSGSVHVA